MLARLKDESGVISIVELVAAMAVLSIALLALMAGYDSAFVSIHNASRQSSASTLAAKQLELYSALQYTSIGLDQTTLATAHASDPDYSSDESGLDNSGSATDVTISGCGTSSQCLPVQTLTGNDGRSYKVETFIRDITVTTRKERFVTVIVRDPNLLGRPLLTKMTSAYDSGP